MEIELFSKIFKDKSFVDLKKMKYKYGADFDEFLKNLEDLYYRELPVLDFNGHNMVFIENYARLSQCATKALLRMQMREYGLKAAEEEIIATSAIENIEFSRESVRKILKGMAPEDKNEIRIMGMKKGLEFISDKNNKITEENLYKLYMMTVGDFLEEEDSIPEGSFYRNGAVYVVGDRVEHTGLSEKKVPEFMKSLIEFANEEDDINELVKASIIHFYLAYVHPYFDGNGRTARLLHLWFLIQKGYQSALFIPFSSRIEKSRKAYYEAYTLVEENKKYSGKIDVTPFVLYFAENVYNKINEDSFDSQVFEIYESAVKQGKITEKETKLWKFVLSYYGKDEFSTKQLEKEFKDAAYATIYSFVMKFEELGLLTSVKYGARIKYKIS